MTVPSGPLEASIERFRTDHRLGEQHCECCSHRISSAMRAHLLEAGWDIPADDLERYWEASIHQLLEAMRSSPDLAWSEVVRAFISRGA